MNGEMVNQLVIRYELPIRFVLVAVLTMISAIVWKDRDNGMVFNSRPSIWLSFICAPYTVKAVVFWGLIEMVFSVWKNIGGDVVASVPLCMYLLKWLFLAYCVLKGHKWPRVYFLVIGLLGIVVGVIMTAKVWNVAHLNMIQNGAVGIMLYYLLARSVAENWRNAVRTAMTNPS